MLTKQDLTTALKYLGGKIDSLRLNPQKVELDLTSKAIEKLQEIDVREMNTVIQSMREVAEGQVKSNKELVETLAAFEKATKDDSRMVDLLKTSQNLQRQTLSAIERMSKELKPEKDDKEYRMLKAVEKAVREIKLEQKETDVSELKTVSRLLQGVQESQNRQSKAVIESLKSLASAVSNLPSQIKLSVPKEFKLDNEQLRSIRSAGSGAIAMAPLDAPNGNLYSGRKIVTTAGTAVALADSVTRCENIVITAESDNTGIISVGDANVVAAEGSQQGVILTPLGSIRVKVADLSKIYIDSTVNGDGVTFGYER